MKIMTLPLVPVALLFISCNATGNSNNTVANETLSVTDTVSEEPLDKTPDSSTQKKEALPLGAKSLIESYPDFITGYEDGTILFKDGTRMVYDDGRDKSFEQMLDDSDPEDMFSMRYEEPDGAPEYLADAGRSRNEQLFKKMYGSSAAAVQRNLVSVDWFGHKVRFTKVNGAAGQLAKVAAEIAQYPELKKYMKSSGTFYWRKVRGANRQSAHSYGIAFDIAVDYSDYWKWKNPKAGETAKIKYANRIPLKIVEIFRKNGFIWGGSWYHYDTMHFEYRPEILRYAELTVGG